MELGLQIKKYRNEMQLSQEDLADQIYVSRQTISNWENDKSYPDINSLLRLSEIFQVSLDILIKGDVPLFMWLGYFAFVPWGILAVIMIIFSFKVETLKKNNSIQTYKEIMAFCNGERLDEIQQAQEKGKQQYQKFFLVLLVVIVTFAVCMLWDLLFASKILSFTPFF